MSPCKLARPSAAKIFFEVKRSATIFCESCNDVFLEGWARLNKFYLCLSPSAAFTSFGCAVRCSAEHVKFTFKGTVEHVTRKACLGALPSKGFILVYLLLRPAAFLVYYTKKPLLLRGTPSLALCCITRALREAIRHSRKQLALSTAQLSAAHHRSPFRASRGSFSWCACRSALRAVPGRPPGRWSCG